MKLDKYKPSNKVERKVDPPYSNWEDKGNRRPLPNIHGINRHYKEDPEMIRDRIEISEGYQDALKGKKTKEDSFEAFVERNSFPVDRVEDVIRKHEKMNKKR